MTSNETDQLVTARKSTHGAFEDHARVTQCFKDVFNVELAQRAARKQPPLSDTQKESIEMILHKLGRIIAGDASFADHWNDIAGYARIANGSVG